MPAVLLELNNWKDSAQTEAPINVNMRIVAIDIEISIAELFVISRIGPSHT